MDNYFAHQELIKKNKLLLTQKLHKSLRMFDRTIGLFYRKRVNGGVIDYSPIKIGKNGQCDLYAVVAAVVTTDIYKQSPIIPVHIELEFKTGTSVLSDEQIIWQSFCKEMNWIHIIVREDTDLIKEIDKLVRAKGLFIWRP